VLDPVIVCRKYTGADAVEDPVAVGLSGRAEYEEGAPQPVLVGLRGRAV
jgi:hypothetical protein